FADAKRPFGGMKKWNPLVSISNIPKKRRVNPLWLKFNPFTVTALRAHHGQALPMVSITAT
ncbi:MAG: hypothetical protein RBT11_18610, partial [Desulfobacterales bacterium]|nr:hypothetical protein [Desulfobacterales bacterium]